MNMLVFEIDCWILWRSRFRNEWKVQEEEMNSGERGKGTDW